MAFHASKLPLETSETRLRSIFAAVAGERPAPLPHVAFHAEPGSEKRGRSPDNGRAGKVLLRSRVGAEVVAQAKRTARLGGITLSAYVTAQVMDRPPPQPRDQDGMTDAYLRRVAASPVVQALDELVRDLKAGTAVDVAATTAALRSIAANIASGSLLTGESPDDEDGTVLVASVTRQVFDRAHKDARRFDSLAAYLSLLIRNPRQPVAPVEPNVLALTLPLTLAGSRVTSAIASVRRRIGEGDDYLGALIPEMREVQRAISDRIVASRADYDALMDARQGDRDDVAWSAGFLEDEA